MEPLGFDVTVATTARIYDYWLGGQDNFAVDRTAAMQIEEAAPGAPLMAIENRRFLGRTVRYLAESGITQFLDIGTGLPTRGNVHEVAQGITPQARVVYVDNDPMVLAQSVALKTGNNVTVLQADLRRPDLILDQARETLDFTQPVAILLVAVLHFIGDGDNPVALIAALRDATAEGSYLVVSHVTGEFSKEAAAQSEARYKKVTPGATVRGRKQILGLFDGYALVEPGLVQVPQWRPAGPVTAGLENVWFLGGVGCKAPAGRM